MGSFSIWHWLIVLLIVVMVFGTKKLKNIGSDLGGAVKGFKDGMKEGGHPRPPMTTPRHLPAQVTQGPPASDKTTRSTSKPSKKADSAMQQHASACEHRCRTFPARA